MSDQTKDNYVGLYAARVLYEAFVKAYTLSFVWSCMTATV